MHQYIILHFRMEIVNLISAAYRVKQKTHALPHQYFQLYLLDQIIVFHGVKMIKR